MIDIALAIESLVPQAQYFGSTTANNKECFDVLQWFDKRAKPKWAEIESSGIEVVVVNNAAR